MRIVNRKFNALRRLAELLEQLGDISSFLPDINKLIPIHMINIDAYANLIGACPSLNLPAVSNADIGQLQSNLNVAYGNLIRKLEKHPWLRMGKVQDQLAKVQAKYNDTLNQGVQFYRCFQAACNAVDTAADFFADISATDFQQEFDDYTQNFVHGNAQVLNQRMTQKRDEVNGTIANINELINPDNPTLPSVPSSSGVSATF